MKISKLKIFEKITDYADGTCRDIIFSGVKWSGIKSYIQKLVNIYSNVEWHVRSPEDEAVDYDKQNGMMWHLARDYAFYAELHKRNKSPSKAKEYLSKAIDIFKECGADGWVGKYEKELATLA